MKVTLNIKNANHKTLIKDLAPGEWARYTDGSGIIFKINKDSFVQFAKFGNVEYISNNCGQHLEVIRLDITEINFVGTEK